MARTKLGLTEVTEEPKAKVGEITLNWIDKPEINCRGKLQEKRK
jgi:hypothetical protein